MEDPLDPSEPGVLARPVPSPSLTGRLRSWVDWVGPGRVVGTAAVVLAVLAAAYWLVKPPPVTSESRLPFATSTTARGGDGGSATTAAPAGATPATTVPAELVVHVAGAVGRSGVYRVPAGSRVVDVVQAAGGLAADAQPDAINLAAPVTDGERVYVPHVGESVPVVATPSTSGAPPGPVNLNTASADQLDELPGIGPATAAAIVAHREQFGPFASVDDLADVKGIGPAKIEVLRGLVTV